MILHNDTPLALAAVPSLADSEGPRLTVLLKGTFRMTPDGVAEPVEEPLPCADDAFEEDDDTRPLRYETDFAPFKPRADLLLVGRAHAPGGTPVERLLVSFAVGSRRRSLEVHGDSEWEGSFLRRRRGRRRPFASLPLGYDRALGGPGDAANPLGLGREPVEDERGHRTRPAPNVVDPAEPVRGPNASASPAGFGPLPRAWAWRNGKIGRFSRSYKDTHWPALPPDFDWGYFNAAPPAMQADYLRGDETIELENLHGAHPRYRCALPGLRPRCFLEDRREGGEPRLREVTLRLDTLWVDAEDETLVLVWRGNPPIHSDDADEVSDLFAVTEALTDEPGDPHEHVARLRAAGEGEEAELAPEPEPEPDAVEKKALDDVLGEIEGMRAKLAEAGVPPALLARLDPNAEVDDFAEGLLAHFGVDPADVDARIAEARAEMARMFEEAGEDPSILTKLAEADADPEIEDARALLLGRFAAGEPLVQEDLSELDLAGIELPGADLSGAILSGCKLEGANLEGARLSEATLVGARLAGARLAGADLTRADLSGCDLSGADLSDALLEDAILQEARLVEARAMRLRGTGADFAGADLSRADLQSAQLERADLSTARLEGAVLMDTDLAEASLEAAIAPGIDLRGARIAKLRASEGADFSQGRFERTRGEGTMWSEAGLEGACFDDADLRGADFSQCRLDGASLRRADLAEGNLLKASLREADLQGANLFQANLGKADLTRADLRGASLFQAETLDAVLEDTRLAGANLKRSKLEGTA